MPNLQQYYRQGLGGAAPAVRPSQAPKSPQLPRFGGAPQFGRNPTQIPLDQWGRPLSSQEAFRQKYPQYFGGSPPVGNTGSQPFAASSPPQSVAAPTRPSGGGTSQLPGMPQVPGFIFAPNGGVFAKTGNEMVNRLLATGMVNFGANLAGSANQSGLPPQLVNSAFAGQGFLPAPFQQPGPYVPPSLGQINQSGYPTGYPAGMPGFDDPITKAIRDAQALRQRSVYRPPATYY